MSSPRPSLVLAACVAAACVLLLPAVLTTPVRAQTADPAFPITDGRVFASATDGQTLWIGGQFTRVGANAGSFAAVDTTTGSLASPFARIDGPVHAIVADPYGGWYVGGDFHTVSGKPRERLAHILADGSLAAWNPGADGTVYALELLGVRLFVGGAFTQAGGQARAHVAVLDAATGTPEIFTADADSVVYALAVGGSRLWIGGRFAHIGGQARDKLAAVDVGTGAVLAFDAHVQAAPGRFAVVQAILPTAATVYVGGSFASFGGQVRHGAAAADVVTGAVTAWDPAGADSPTVYALATDGTRLFVGGGFASLSGQPRSGLAAVSPTTGALDAWNPGVNGAVLALDLRPGRIVAGGAFGLAGGQAHSGVAEFELGSGAVTAWNPLGSGTVRAVAHAANFSQAGSRIAFGSDYLLLAGGGARANLAAIDLATKQLLPWNPGVTGWVTALALDGTRLYVGGEFTLIAGQARTRLAALDGGTGALLPWAPGAPDLRVEGLAAADGKVYACGGFTQVTGVARGHAAAFDAASGALTAWNPNVDNWVNSVALWAGRVFLGGTFTTVGGQPRANFAAVDSVAGTVLPWIADANNVVECVAWGGSGRVYIGGWFTSIGGAPRNRLACFDTTTATITSWNPDMNAPVQCLAPSGGLVYAGGPFTTVGGVPVQGVAVLNPNTGSPGTYNPALDYWPHTLQPASGAVYVGGDLYSSGSSRLMGLARVLSKDLVAPNLHVLSPTGGGISAEHVSIDWTTSDAQPVRWVDIDYSDTGTGGPWTPIAVALPNQGHFAWFVPAFLSPALRGAAADGYVRVTGTDLAGNTGSDMNDAGFYFTGTGGVEGGPTALFARIAPNPARADTRITFGLPVRARARVATYDLQGRLAAPVLDHELEAGVHDVPLPAGLRPGLYFLQLSVGPRTIRQRFVVLD